MRRERLSRADLRLAAKLCTWAALDFSRGYRWTTPEEAYRVADLLDEAAEHRRDGGDRRCDLSG